jgi:hypothetical protein
MAYDPGLVCAYEHKRDLREITNWLGIASCFVSGISLLVRAFDTRFSQEFPGNLAAQLKLIAVS